MENLFSFAGNISCKRMWLTMISVGIVGSLISAYLPVTEHKITRGIGSISYVTADSWIVLFVYYAIGIVFSWIWIAAMVKRLHDRGHSGKWLAIFLGWFAVALAIGFIAPTSGPFATVGVTISVIVFAPLTLFGIWGFFEIFLFPSKEVPAGLV